MDEDISVWITQALRDFEVAKKNALNQDYYVSVFFCQQSIEKSLKGLFLQEQKESSGPTHSLLYLAKNTGVPDSYLSFLRKITPEFVNTRYPDASYGIPAELYDEEIAQEYIQKTEELLTWIKSKLK